MVVLFLHPFLPTNTQNYKIQKKKKTVETKQAATRNKKWQRKSEQTWQTIKQSACSEFFCHWSSRLAGIIVYDCVAGARRIVLRARHRFLIILNSWNNLHTWEMKWRFLFARGKKKRKHRTGTGEACDVRTRHVRMCRCWCLLKYWIDVQCEWEPSCRTTCVTHAYYIFVLRVLLFCAVSDDRWLFAWIVCAKLAKRSRLWVLPNRSLTPTTFNILIFLLSLLFVNLKHVEMSHRFD